MQKGHESAVIKMIAGEIKTLNSYKAAPAVTIPTGVAFP